MVVFTAHIHIPPLTNSALFSAEDCLSLGSKQQLTMSVPYTFIYVVIITTTATTTIIPEQSGWFNAVLHGSGSISIPQEGLDRLSQNLNISHPSFPSL